MQSPPPLSPTTPSYEDESPLFDEENDLLAFPIAALPPLAKPQRDVLRRQMFGGVLVVGSTILWAVGITHGLAWYVEFEPVALWSPLLFAIRVQALVAIVAHVNICFGDTGEVKRSRGNCLPVPPVVAERLRAGDSLDGLDNIHDDSDGASYCVRCCVWRRAPPPPAERAVQEWQQWLWRHHPAVASNCPCAGGRPAHHCSVCQRCTADHDHHCGVLGRCITGRNMPWFVLLVAMGWAAGAMVGWACLLTIAQHWGMEGVVYAGYAFVVWCLLTLCAARPVQRLWCLLFDTLYGWLAPCLAPCLGRIEGCPPDGCCEVYRHRHNQGATAWRSADERISYVTDLPIAHARVPTDDEDLKEVAHAEVVAHEPAVRL